MRCMSQHSAHQVRSDCVGESLYCVESCRSVLGSEDWPMSVDLDQLAQQMTNYYSEEANQK